MKIETENLTPIYLRDLKPELRPQYMDDIKADHELLAAHEAGDDIIVGWYAPKLLPAV